ncbi:DUF6262 family protein [Gordonia sputi]
MSPTPPPPSDKARQGLAIHRERIAAGKRRDIEKALRELRKSNTPISVAAVAARANVSRKTIYKHKDLYARIDQHRQLHASANIDQPSKRESAVITALRRKIAAQQDEIKELRAAVTEKDTTIAILYGRLDDMQEE